MDAGEGRVLEGQVAIVTGGAGDIGRASAGLFARAGARLVLADVRAGDLDVAVVGIRDAGGEAIGVAGDLQDPAECARVVEAAIGTFGRVDVLFNNAAVGTLVVGGTVETISIEHWDLTQEVNLRAMYLTSRAAVPQMRRMGGGAIVNMSSVSAFQGARTRPTHAYAAAKGAVLSLTRAMAVSFGGDRIRVNAICPGLIRTRLTADIVEAAAREAIAGRGIPVGRVGEPGDIAQCALFLASNASAFITGTAIIVDGGGDGSGGLRNLVPGHTARAP
jgi:NAD(P)-dependent dehydrogenase (short-subunit alcohol dehydrogenase family)